MDSNKKMIIEFNGLPGCGKTTIVKELEKILQDQNILYFDLTDVYNYKEKGKGAQILNFILAIFSIKQMAINLQIIKYSLLYNINLERLKFTLILIKLVFQINRVQKHEVDVVLLLEEGIIQFTSSISHLESIVDENQLEKLLLTMVDNMGPVLFVNCLLDIEIAAKRIKERQYKDRRIDSMASSSMLYLLKVKDNTLKTMQLVINQKYIIDISADISPKDNAVKVFSFLKESY